MADSYAKILVRARLIQVAQALPERATPEQIADAVLAAAETATAKLTKGEVSLTFELMPSEAPADPPSLPDQPDL